mmetsp:Transcript_38715/g.101162  ORF Transcript_38715/g.101162 Transcript_38715/m.101162 type:complete len:545 (+) Transcript_38715:33-1667(+)
MESYEVVYKGGVAYRTEPVLSSKHDSVAKGGERVRGQLVDSDWIRTDAGLFLPLKAPNGKSILKKAGPSRPEWVDVAESEPAPAAPPPKKVDELAVLAARKPEQRGVVTRVHAASSHIANQAYMKEFQDGLEEMGVDTSGDSYLKHYAGPSAPSRRASMPVEASGECLDVTGRVSSASARWKTGPRNADAETRFRSVKHGVHTESVVRGGRAVDVSDRNILCMSIFGDSVAFGSADHGIAEIAAASGTKKRSLHSKRYGHAEWVTSVSHCADGRILSAGMDTKLCLWNASGVVCSDLTGHRGSISKVRCSAVGPPRAVSCSYDRTLRVWDLVSKRELCSMGGHSGPVLDFVWTAGRVISGGRDSMVKMWDLATGECSGTMKGHQGHITAMHVTEDDHIVATGAQDGNVRIWDLRARRNTNNMEAHPGGAVNEIKHVSSSAKTQELLVTVGADGRVLVLEPRMQYNPLLVIGPTHEDFVYSMCVVDTLILTGDGKGVILCHDSAAAAAEPCYALHPMDNAIRCMGAVDNILVCAGDDGNATFYDF